MNNDPLAEELVCDADPVMFSEKLHSNIMASVGVPAAARPKVAAWSTRPAAWIAAAAALVAIAVVGHRLHVRSVVVEPIAIVPSGVRPMPSMTNPIKGFLQPVASQLEQVGYDRVDRDARRAVQYVIDQASIGLPGVRRKPSSDRM